MKTEHCDTGPGSGCGLRDHPRGRRAARDRLRPAAVCGQPGAGIPFPQPAHPDRPAAQAQVAARHRMHGGRPAARGVVDRQSRADAGRTFADHLPGVRAGPGGPAVQAGGQVDRGDRCLDLVRRGGPPVDFPVHQTHRPVVRLLLQLARGRGHRRHRVRRRADRADPRRTAAGHPDRPGGRPGLRHPGRADQADAGDLAGTVVHRVVPRAGRRTACSPPGSSACG